MKEKQPPVIIAVVGRKGVIGVVEIDLWPKEKLGLQNSGKVLRETLEKVL